MVVSVFFTVFSFDFAGDANGKKQAFSYPYQLNF